MKDGRIKPKRPTVRSGRALLEQWMVRGRMNQAEAAAQIGISRIKLNQYLHNVARPSLETAIRIEDATGIGMRSWLLEDAPPECLTADAAPPGPDKAGTVRVVAPSPGDDYVN